jgi:hypothetical protein
LEKIYVLPPSQNEVHFFLNTTYPTYGWFKAVPVLEAIRIPDVSGVIVVKKDAMLPFEFLMARLQFQYDSAQKILKQQGFQPVVDLRSFTLWRKVN